MNNVISILVDSVSWQATEKNIAEVSPTPFLDRLKKESITASKMYAQGPYTDAASKALYTGEDTLCNFGYYYRLNHAANNHFGVFHQNGYHTIGMYYPFYMYGNEIKKDIDEVYYTSQFEFGSEWNGTYYYYAGIINERKLNDVECAILSKRIQLMFDVWIGFYEDLREKPETGRLISREIKDFDIGRSLDMLYQRQKEFIDDTNTFIAWFLSDEGKQYFYEIDKISVDAKLDYQYIEILYQKYKDFFALADKNNRKVNIFKNRIVAKQLFYQFGMFLKTRSKDYLKPFYQYFSSLSSIKQVMKDYKVHKWQYVPSAFSQLTFAFDTIMKYRGSDPLYVSIHLEDLHGYINFFTHDTTDLTTTEAEFKVLSEYIQSLGTNFKGNLAYLLSLRYTDYCIERFVDKLKKVGKWDKTTLLIVADHGNASIGYPIHEKGKQTNCFYDENYHIPVYIRTPAGIRKEIDYYCNSKDILPTLLDVEGIDKPTTMRGVSLLDNNRPINDFVITEYMGPGCPDMLTRDIWYSIRDVRYTVAYMVKATEEFEKGRVVEIYDLNKDPLCKYNCLGKIKTSEVDYLLKKLRVRHEEIRKDTIGFLEHINEKNKRV